MTRVLPRFPSDFADAVVRAEDGREDKIEIALRSWVISATAQEYEEIRQALAPPPPSLRFRQTDFSERDHTPLWMFSMSLRGRLEISRAALRSADGEIIRRPLLFSGKLVRAYQARQSPDHHATELRLSLNPLRYVRHQPVTNPLPNPARGNWPVPQLVEADLRHDDEEFSLDGQDNWLPNTTRVSAFANSARWRRHLRAYIYGIGNAFSVELERVARELHYNWRLEQDFTLRKVEHVWEFTVEEPIELVLNLAPQLMQLLAGRVTARAHDAPISRTGNALSTEIELRRGIRLRVYAKTNRRVRFEIIQDEINHRELLNETRGGRTGRTQIRSWESIFECLEALRERAADELNQVFLMLARRSSVLPSQVSPVGLLTAIVSALPNRQRAHTFISLLIYAGGIRPRPCPPELETGIEALRAAGIIAYDQRRRVYDVTAAYAAPMHTLRASSVASWITTGRVRQRRR